MEIMEMVCKLLFRDSTSVQLAGNEKGQNDHVFGTLFGSFAGITRDRLG